MASKFHVFSTLSSDNIYTPYDKSGELPVATGGVLIRGGTGVADKNGDAPLGVRTEITPEQLDAIKDEPTFKLHQKNGHIQIREVKDDAEKVVGEGMEASDGGVQKRPEDFPKNGPQPTTGKKDK